MQDKLVQFVFLPTFDRAVKGLLDEAAMVQIEQTLVADPEHGAVMAGTGGVRKMRVALSGRGKRGGARVVYYYRSHVGKLIMITAYAKNQRDNLTKEQRNRLKELTAVLDNEG